MDQTAKGPLTRTSRAKLCMVEVLMALAYSVRTFEIIYWSCGRIAHIVRAERNMYLAEDRILCFEIVTKKREGWMYVLDILNFTLGSIALQFKVCQERESRNRCTHHCELLPRPSRPIFDSSMPARLPSSYHNVVGGWMAHFSRPSMRLSSGSASGHLGRASSANSFYRYASLLRNYPLNLWLTSRF